MIVVPQQHEDDITTGKMAKIEDGKVVFTMENINVVPKEELDRVARVIKAGMDK